MNLNIELLLNVISIILWILFIFVFIKYDKIHKKTILKLNGLTTYYQIEDATFIKERCSFKNIVLQNKRYDNLLEIMDNQGTFPLVDVNINFKKIKNIVNNDINNDTEEQIEFNKRVNESIKFASKSKHPIKYKINEFIYKNKVKKHKNNNVVDFSNFIVIEK